MVPVEAVLDALSDQQEELAALLTAAEDEWTHPVPPCPGWDLSDVVLHLALTNELAIASLRGTFAEVMGALTEGLSLTTDVDDAAGRMVDAARGEPGEVVHARWRMSVDALGHAFAEADGHDRVPWVAGDLSVRTLATTRLAETWIHTTDVAAGLGMAVAPTDRLWHIARLAWRTLPYAFRRAGLAPPGPIAFDLTGPGGDTWTFSPEVEPATVVHGPAADLCAVAGQRRAAADTDLTAAGPDAEAALRLVRTFA